MSTGLLLVDIQNDYFPGGKMELPAMVSAANNAERLLAFFRENKQPVFHIQHIFNDPKAGFFLPETKGAEIHFSVIPHDDEVLIEKHYPNSFRETMLLDELQKNEVDQVVICGAMSQMCVEATGRAAADLGLKTTVVHDACAAGQLRFEGEAIPVAHIHGTAMASLAWGYAQVTATEEFLLV